MNSTRSIYAGLGNKPLCIVCKQEITRPRARRYCHCSNKCKQKAYRERKKALPAPGPKEVTPATPIFHYEATTFGKVQIGEVFKATVGGPASWIKSSTTTGDGADGKPFKFAATAPVWLQRPCIVPAK